jgi:hypothetical protein
MQLLLEAQADESSRANDLLDVNEIAKITIEKKLTEEV